MDLKTKYKTYHVVCIKNNKIAISGKANHELWDCANELTDFSSPWDSKKVNKITFKALWSKTELYFCFKVEDSEIYIDKGDNTKVSINNSDRVEIFFKKGDEMNPYYCFEIDPNARLMDFKAYPNKVFDFNWSWPKEGLIIKSNCTNIGYTIEGSISIRSLKALNLIKENRIEAGLFRAKYNKTGDAIYEPTWISWVNPKTENPDFHTASSFGILQLM